MALKVKFMELVSLEVAIVGDDHTEIMVKRIHFHTVTTSHPSTTSCHISRLGFQCPISNQASIRSRESRSLGVHLHRRRRTGNWSSGRGSRNSRKKVENIILSPIGQKRHRKVHKENRPNQVEIAARNKKNKMRQI